VSKLVSTSVAPDAMVHPYEKPGRHRGRASEAKKWAQVDVRLPTGKLVMLDNLLVKLLGLPVTLVPSDASAPDDVLGVHAPRYEGFYTIGAFAPCERWSHHVPELEDARVIAEAPAHVPDDSAHHRVLIFCQYKDTIEVGGGWGSPGPGPWRGHGGACRGPPARCGDRARAVGSLRQLRSGSSPRAASLR